MSGHTPSELPWSFDGDWYRIPTILDANGQRVASVEKDERAATPERAANAALIVKAVNSHAANEAKIEALVQALTPFAELHNEGSEDFTDDEPVLVRFGRTSDFTIKLGDIRQAAAAFQAATGERE